MNIKEEMQMQIAQLNMWTKAYDEGHPIVSDKQWDEAYFRLVDLENKTGIIFSNSPTQKISYQIVNELKKVKHNHPMLSADKTKDWNDFVNYFGNHDVVGMLKLDGLTLSIRYVDGNLVSAETRGNGIEGEDVLHNAQVIHSIPKHINYTEELIVDGEIICRYSDFEQFSNDYANPRNFASGSIRLLDSHECEKRKLTFVAWHAVKGLTNNILDNFYELKKLGFVVTPYTSSFDFDAKEFLIGEAEKLGYPIDGLVGRFTDKEYGESLGSTGHHSKAIYAFKFYDEEVETELKAIEYDVSRQGILTPVAVFNEVELEGSINTRASLHNLSVMEELLGKHPEMKQKIWIKKAHQIIPQVSRAEYRNDIPHDHCITIPDYCPICFGSTEIKISDGGVKMLYCANPNCEGKLAQQVDHFVGKRGLDVKGLSRVTIEKLINAGWINRRADVFKLHNKQKEWESIPGFGAKSVSNILNAIEGAKHTNFEAYLSSLGIPLIGRTVSKELSKVFASYYDFRKAIKEGYDFTQLEGFGYEMNKSLTQYDYTEADEIAEILEFQQQQTSTSAAVEGLTFVITGKLSKKRDDIKADIEAAGGKVTGSVSSKTNYLVCNDKNSNTGKSKDAKALGIPIITEEELMKMLN